ncbi:MAG TPA: M28 family peptidase [Candidatus Saccharimonadales bacterium]|nr:M28 family peptidase [Candidatus Saccharimonadales bacterium]
MRLFTIGIGLMGLGLLVGDALAQKPPLLPEKDVAALANELSGETAKRNLEGIARFHRQRGSAGFHAAAELVAERLRAYGLSDVTILQFPADGKTFYGTQRSRPAWDAQEGTLWEVAELFQKRYHQGSAQGQNLDRQGKNWNAIANYESQPIVLAEDSESADVTADLVDVGEGSKESDYSGKKVKGQIVLVSAQPGAVQDLAVGKFGAVGIVSYAQNQKTAWSGEDENLIRWGHLETFSPNKTFAFMVSLKMARGFRERLAKEEKIQLHAAVKAGQHPGTYEVATGAIASDDPANTEEIVFSCHLDHQRPGANDNASGCATILEVARTLQKLISEEKLQRPPRTIRFVFPPEVEGTMALLTHTGQVKVAPVATKVSGASQIKIERTPGMLRALQTSDAAGFPFGDGYAAHTSAVIHMDMVGGGPETKAVFHVTRGPMSLPSFVHDVAWSFAEWMNEESYEFAATGSAEYPLVAPEGGKEPLRAEYSAFTMGSDHDVYQDSSFGIPVIYLNDWPDRYIHTNFDTGANIDTTKLKRAAFIGAASGYFLAQELTPRIEELSRAVNRGELLRREQRLKRDESLSTLERGDAEAGYCYYERGIDEQLAKLRKIEAKHSLDNERRCFTDHPAFDAPKEELQEKFISYKRSASSKGPLSVFGFDFLRAELVKHSDLQEPRLLRYEGLWGAGEEYSYEVLNLVETAHSRVRIWEQVSAEYGPVPYEMVVEYLETLKKIGVVEAAK